MEERVAKALEWLRDGRAVLIYDSEGREEETDLVLASEWVGPEEVRLLRSDAGGLICATVPDTIASALGLPFLEEVLEHARQRFPILEALAPGDLGYDRRSSFSLTLNHRDTFTGVTDRDRALTISRFAQLIRDANLSQTEKFQQRFGEEFRSPGHVFLLRAAPKLLEERRGHTELATALTMMAAVAPSATICEMLDGGDALAKEDAKRYAQAHHLPFLEGKDILGAWSKWSG